VADLVHFLASDASNFIGGQVIRLDGGLTAPQQRRWIQSCQKHPNGRLIRRDDEAVLRTDQGFAAKSETLHRFCQSSLSLRAP
jgi:hypothetical protein